MANKGFRTLLGDLSYSYRVKFCVLFETHTSRQKVKNLIKEFGFDGFFVMDGDGFSRGIWCLWKKLKWQVDIVKGHK